MTIGDEGYSRDGAARTGNLEPLKTEQTMSVIRTNRLGLPMNKGG